MNRPKSGISLGTFHQGDHDAFGAPFYLIYYRMLPRKFAPVALPLLLLSAVPATAGELTADEARDLAQVVCVFGFGIVENHRAMFRMSVYDKSPQHGGFNNYVHARTLLGPDDALVVSANNDTLHSATWADLRVEPQVMRDLKALRARDSRLRKSLK